MSESFKRILRTRSAEQLVNMSRNREDWSDEEHALILAEIANRGLDIFEEPTEWSDEEIEGLNLEEPTTQFEKDMAYLVKEKRAYEQSKPLALSTQIVSISSMLVSFSYLYVFYDLSNVWAFSGVILGIFSLILFIKKQFWVSLSLGVLAILIALILFVKELYSVYFIG